MVKAGIIGILILVLLSATVSAVQINSATNSNDAIKLKAGGSVQRTYAIALNQNETVVLNAPSITLSGVLGSISQSYYTQSGSLTITFFAQDDAEVGFQNVALFFQSNQANQNANLIINLTVATSMYQIYDSFVQKGSILQVGSNIKVTVNGAAPDVSYTVSGCGGYDQNMIVAKNAEKSFNCGDVKLSVNPTELYIFGDQVAIKMHIESNQNLLVSPYTNTTTVSSCELSLNTISTAQRGRLFGLEAVDTDGKPVQDVSVIVTDVGGGADDMHEVTDRTGYTSFRIPEEAVGALIIRLSKEGCEAFNKQIEFGVSYEAYQATRIREAAGKSLIINGTASTIYSGDSFSGYVNTGLGDRIDGAEVRAMSTKSEKVYSVTTNKQGKFSFDTLDEAADWTIQAKKDGYQLSDELTVSVLERKYLTLVPMVDGSFTNIGVAGQKIQFKLTDSRGEIVPISGQVRFGNQNVNIVSGMSDIVQLTQEGVINANVAEQPGYTAATATITVKKNLTYYYIAAGAGFLVVILIIIAVRKKGRRPLSYGMGGVFDEGEVAMREA